MAITLMEKLRLAIQERRVLPIFKPSDLQAAGIEDPNNNLSNYDKKNRGPQNKHKTVLVSREIGEDTYYTFDEQIFDLD